MLNANAHVPPPTNERVLDYAPGSPERATLRAQLDSMARETLDLPLVIDGKEVRTGKQGSAVMPHAHEHVLARFHMAGPAEVQAAIDAAVRAQPGWAALPQTARAAVFLRAAELLATRYRPIVNGATMLGQSKTAHQAEIDAACELIDFLRFNCHFAERILAEQPVSSPGTWNLLDTRPLEGFVFAVSPFNFTSIGGNLPTAPAVMGNTVVWKPASTSVYSAHFIMQLLLEAGLPPGVINFVYGSGGAGRRSGAGEPSPRRHALHRLHRASSRACGRPWAATSSATEPTRASSARRAARTSSSRTRAPTSTRSRWPSSAAASSSRGRSAARPRASTCRARSAGAVRDRVVAMIEEITVGDPRDFRHFMAAVIDRNAYREHVGYIEHARKDGSKILAGGTYDDKVGYFIQPTLVETPDPRSKLMREEIFGPVLTWHVYDAKDVDGALALCDGTSPYALTGAVFARDRKFIERASWALRNAAGNFYVNDKPTGAVVGQQPFGGARASGTNDKAGSLWNLVRWVSPRSVKENLAPPTSWKYPYMSREG